jgi:tetratricopeptide (TPR) repeat protein
VLILDALNQLEDKDNALDLVWLPPVIPENIRLILSTLSGRPLVDLIKRQWSVMEVQPLNIAERKKLIREYLAQYRKTLSREWIDSIASAGLTHNPLYLRSLLEELRVFGEYEQLDDRITHYLITESIPELFERILERYEMDYNQDRPHLVRDAMTIIWASRQGISEAELLDTLGENNEALPQAFWVPFCLAAGRFFISRSGLICFSHGYIRQAIENQYLPTEDKKQAAHQSLADYFSTKEIVPRVIDELPWQLAKAKSWQRLYDLLTNLEFFEKSWEKNKYDVMSYWATIERSSSVTLKEAYGNVVDNPVGVYNDKMVLYVSDLLTHMGNPEKALSLLRFLTEYYRQTDALKSLGECLSKQAAILWRHGDLDGAMMVLNEQEGICRELGDPHGLESALRYQAVVLQKRGNLDKAMELNKEAEHICLQHGITEGLQWSLGNQGYLLLDKGNMESAMTLFKEQERICREIGNRSSLQICLGNQAGVFMRHGEMENAMPLLKEQEHISREFGDLIGIHVSLGNQAAILSKWGKLNEAMVLSKEKERICRELKDTASLQVSLINQAWILKELGDLDGAMTLFKETESNCRELKLPDTLASSIVNQAQILEKKGNMKEALDLAEKAYQLASEHSLTHLAEKVVKPVMDRIRSKME